MATMSGPTKVRYRLPWPGLGSLPLFVIDNSDVVYSAENRLPPRLRHMCVPENQYVRLHDLLASIADNASRVQANAMLNQLIIDYGLRSLRTIACFKATPAGQQVVVDQYLPISTLLVLLVIFPNKTFDRFRRSLMDFLENNRDMPCMGCGFIRRNCTCKDPDCLDDDSEQISLGFGIQYSDKCMQTDEVQKTSSKKKRVSPTPVEEEQPQVITGPGGMKVVLPPGTKMGDGAKVPLTMSSGPAGPFLTPTISPMANSLPINYLPNPGPMMPPPPMPYSMDPSVLMPPPPRPPPLAFPQYDSHAPINIQHLLPSHHKGMPVQKIPRGPPSGTIDIRLPDGCNPRYINTIAGTYKKVVSLRNVAIQVDTVVLPKKKNKMDTSVTHIYSGVKSNAPSSSPSSYQTLIRKGINGNNGTGVKKIKKMIVRDPADGKPSEKNGDGDSPLKPHKALQFADLDEETAKLMDEDTLAMLNKMDRKDQMEKAAAAAASAAMKSPGGSFMLKPPVVKKVDKVWRMIEDDSEDEEDAKKDDKKDDEVKSDQKGDKQDEKSDEKSDQKVDDEKKETESDEKTDDGKAETVSKRAENKESSEKVEEAKTDDPSPIKEATKDETSGEALANEDDKDNEKKSDSQVGEVSSADHPEEKAEPEKDYQETDTQKASTEQEASTKDKTELPMDTFEQKESPKEECSVSKDNSEEKATPMDTSVDDYVKEESMMDKSSADSEADQEVASVTEKMEEDAFPMVINLPDSGAHSPVDLTEGDDVATRPSSATDEIEREAAEEERRRSVAAEVLGSLARLAPLVSTGAGDDNPKTAEESNQGTEKADAKEEKPVVDKPEASTPVKSPEEGKSVDKTVESSALEKPKEEVKEEDNNNGLGNSEGNPLVIDEGGATKSSGDKKNPDDKENIVDLIPKSPPMLQGTVNADSSKKYFAKFEHLPTGEKLYRCTFPTCSQCFDTRDAAKLHNQTHTKEENLRRLLCLECDYKVPFFKWFDLLRHMKETHKKGLSEDPNACLYCGLVFETQDLLARHMEFHYSSRYKCVHCGNMMMSWGQVQLHMDTCPEKDQSKVNFGCPYCMFVFHKRTIRNLHMLSHTDRGLSCALCDDNTVQWEHWKQLRKHYQQRHAKALMSKIGPFREKLPKKKKNPKCHMCGQEFKSADFYNVHMFKVHDLVPYTLVPCNVCDKTFRTRRRLDWHMKSTHEEEVGCTQCDFVGKNKTVLKIHMSQKHADEQHVCTECGKSFTYFHQLRVHMAHHARRIVHTCRTCGQEFTRSAELRKHVHEEHQDPGDRKAHYCTDCSYWTYTRSTLLTHVQKKHPGSTTLGTAATSDDDDNDNDDDATDSAGPTPPRETAAAATVTSPPEEDDVKTMYDHRRPPATYARAARGTDSKLANSRKKKKRKRLTMPSRRVPVSRGAKTAEATVIRPLVAAAASATRGRSMSDDKLLKKRQRQEEEQQRKIKRLRRSSCARTRSLDEQKALGEGGDIGGDLDMYEGLTIAAGADATSPGTAPTGGFSSFGRKTTNVRATTNLAALQLMYPYLDHCYCRLDVIHSPAVGPTPNWKRDSDQESALDIVSTPTVSGVEVIKTSPRRRVATRPATDSLPLPALSSQLTSSKLQSPVQIRSLISRALQASPTKRPVTALSQQLRSLTTDPLDLDLSELINEDGEILVPEQDLLTDILNSMDSLSGPGTSTAGLSSTSPRAGGLTATSPRGLSTSPKSAAEAAAAAFVQSAEGGKLVESLLEEAAQRAEIFDNKPSTSAAPPATVPIVASVTTTTRKEGEASFDEEEAMMVLDATPVTSGMVLPPDIDEIELKEADWQLWQAEGVQGVAQRNSVVTTVTSSDGSTKTTQQPLASFDNSLENVDIIVEFKDQDGNVTSGEANAMETETESATKSITQDKKDVPSTSSDSDSSKGHWLMDHQYF